MSPVEGILGRVSSTAVTTYEVFHMSSILFGGTMVPIIEQDYILLFGYSILNKEYHLTGFITEFNNQKKASQITLNAQT